MCASREAFRASNLPMYSGKRRLVDNENSSEGGVASVDFDLTGLLNSGTIGTTMVQVDEAKGVGRSVPFELTWLLYSGATEMNMVYEVDVLKFMCEKLNLYF